MQPKYAYKIYKHFQWWGVKRVTYLGRENTNKFPMYFPNWDQALTYALGELK